MGSLIRSSVLWGYDDLVRELGGDPERFLSRFAIPPDIPTATRVTGRAG